MRRCLILLISVMMIIVNVPTSNGLSYKKATVVEVDGMVSILKSGGEKMYSPKVTDMLEHGDRVITGKKSTIAMQVDSDKYIKVGEKTYISLSELMSEAETGGDATNVKLFTGQVWASISSKLSAEDSFEIETPTAVMGAKGTKYLVSYVGDESDHSDENSTSKLYVFEGIVSARIQLYGQFDTDSMEDQLTVDLRITPNKSISIDYKTIHDIVISVENSINSGLKITDINIQSLVEEMGAITPVKNTDLDLFMLEIIKASPGDFDPSLLEDIDYIIEQKGLEKSNTSETDESELEPEIIYAISTLSDAFEKPKKESDDEEADGASPVIITMNLILDEANTIRVSLDDAIINLLSDDVIVKNNEITLTRGIDYMLSTDLTGEVFNITLLEHANVNESSVISVEISKEGYLVTEGELIMTENTSPIPVIPPIIQPDVEITISTSQLEAETGTTTLTLDKAIETLQPEEIIVERDSVVLDEDIDYMLSPDLTGMTFSITFLESAGLKSNSVIRVEISKVGYLINEVIVENAIPLVIDDEPPVVIPEPDIEITGSSSGVETETDTATITLGGVIDALASADIVVKKDEITLTEMIDYTLSGDLTGMTFSVTFLENAALVSTNVITLEISKPGYIVNSNNPILLVNNIGVVEAEPIEIPVPVSIVVVTFNKSIPNLTPDDIEITNGGIGLIYELDYTLGFDLDNKQLTVTLLAHANVDFTDVVKVHVTKKNYVINNSQWIEVTNLVSPELIITASSSAIVVATDSTTITLSAAITDLQSSDIVVKKDSNTLVANTDYSLSSDLSGVGLEITFLGNAALDTTSIITVEITKPGYLINSGDPISIENNIPSPL